MNVEVFRRSSAKALEKAAVPTLQHFNPSTLTIINCQRARKINLHLLKQIADDLLVGLKIAEAELEINLVAEPEMTQLNEKFLRHKGPTDVITFDYGFGIPLSGGFPPKHPGRTNRPKPELQTLHGEVFICVDEAVRQARQFRTSWQSEVVLYLVHGVLHLLGHDDSRVGERRKMKREENRLVRRLSRRFSLAQLARAAKLSACKGP
jgi:probable rRNA maturation factor